MPFIIADTNRSNWVNQDYNLEMQMTTPLLWNRVIIGITGRYQNAVGAKQLDPRPLCTFITIYSYPFGDCEI